MANQPDQFFIDSALRTIALESSAISALGGSLDASFATACHRILETAGRVVVTGMGKSGHIAGKIAATLASTGTPAFFVHPGEASHGDMGMITQSDCVIALSNSGGTFEILTLLPLIKRLNIPLISITGDGGSELARASDVHLLASIETEACPLNLAPTSSTTTALVMGDALAIATLEARGFTAEEFAFSHPGGALGKRLLLRVADVMVRDNEIPSVRPTVMLADALYEMTAKGLGMTTIASEDGALLGVFTDGDLRRVVEEKTDFRSTPLSAVMTAGARSINEDLLAAEAMSLMERNQISSLVIVDNDNKIQGVVTLLALLKAGIS
ncbi:MAG: KpsF/GutQ family sugar-phosphate isomerase [Halieaceae bacterium]|jgi:arabinose-5-phosphate isomerase|nr:MAG: KpsF/GutQ family sugar-phosphate isomerase [Halieaceae bacterium]|tara:strand:+ start:10673 stop:11653 length:981 start_codon:yes stop_codon:yes gene_type:complete